MKEAKWPLLNHSINKYKGVYYKEYKNLKFDVVRTDKQMEWWKRITQLHLKKERNGQLSSFYITPHATNKDASIIKQIQHVSHKTIVLKESRYDGYRPNLKNQGSRSKKNRLQAIECRKREAFKLQNQVEQEPPSQIFTLPLFASLSKLSRIIENI